MREKAIFRPSFEHATPHGVMAFFCEVFAALDARPREVDVEIDFSEAAPVAPVVLDFERGEPVFRQVGKPSSHGRLRGRWLAEHDVPMNLSATVTAFCLVPCTGNRVAVRVHAHWRTREIFDKLFTKADP